MLHEKTYITIGAKKVIDDVVKEIRTGWKPTLGYGWSDAKAVAKELKIALEKSDHGSELTLFALAQWGVGGNKVAKSEFGFIGIWVAMLDYYFAAYFSSKSGLSKLDLDRQVLWSQQSAELEKGNFITKIYDENVSPFGELKKAYKLDKPKFKEANWKSVMNMAGPGETQVWSGSPLGPQSLKKLVLSEENYDGYTEILNMAWLEGLFTEQSVPIFLYNALNLDEIWALRHALRLRDQIIGVDYEWMAEMIEDEQGEVTPEATLLFLLREVLTKFYEKMYRASKRRFVNLGQGGVRKIRKNRSTIAQLMTVKDSFACAEISCLLKVSPSSKASVRPTGTGKELFYLVAKGASVFLCGEVLILSRTGNVQTLAKQLGGLSPKVKQALRKHYQPSGGKRHYRAITKCKCSSIPFVDLDASPETLAKQLFALQDLEVSYDSLFDV